MLNSVLFLALSYLEHGRNIRPSSTLILYLFFSAALDVIRLRTMWSVQLPSSIQNLSTVSLILKGIILVLEASEKTGFLPYHFHAHRPEETSSVLNRGIFYWLNSLLWKGASGFLAPDNIYDLDTKLTADHLSTPFIQAWLSGKKLSPKLSVIKALLQTLKWQILAAVFPRIVLLVLTVCQPLLLQQFLLYLAESEPKQHSIGRGLIVLYTLLYFALAVSTGFYWHAHFRTLTMVRSCLISALNWQVTRLDLQAIGDPKAALSLMSSDMEQIQGGLQGFHEFWANLVQVGVTAYLLQKQVGIAFLMPAAIALIASCLATWAGKASGGRQKAWMEAVERRISLLSSMLPSMQEVKMKGLTTILENVLIKYRKIELHLAGRARMLVLFVVMSAFAPEFLAPPATFLVSLVISSTSHRQFDAPKAFTSLTLIMAMTSPLNNLFQSLPGYLGAWASLRRIEEFMCAAELEDFRDVQMGVIPANRTAEEDVSGPGEADAIPLTVFPKRQQITDEGSFAIKVTDGCFGWTSEKDILHDITVTIPARKLTFIVGPVASGKSTLCKAFLGETKASKGRVDLTLARGGISFCDQTPYLKNATVKENIVGFSEFDESWYQTVIHASALGHDISSFQKGDQTLVGTNGANLSGGQRHKVAFARALYARNKIIILDDIFSGLDANSAEHLFRHGIGPESLTQKHGMTVIFATHAIRFLPQSQYVIALGSDGRVVQDGTYADLQKQAGYIQDLKLLQDQKTDGDAGNTEDAAALTAKEMAQSTADDNELDAARQQGDFSVYKYYFGAVGTVCTILMPIFGILTSVFFNLGTLSLKVWTDASTNPNSNNAMYLGIYATFQGLALIGMLFLAHHVLIRLVTRAGLELHNRVLKSMMNAPLAMYSKTDAGSIINRFSQDMTLLDMQLAMGMVSLVYCVCLMTGQAVVIGVASPWTAASYPAIMFVFYVIQKFYLRTSRQIRFLDLEAKSPLYTYFLETTSGLATLRAFAWTKPNLQVGQKLLDQSQRPAYLLYMIQRWLSFVLDSVAAGMAAIISALAVTQNSSSGFAGTALSQLMFLNLLMKTIIVMWTEVETSIGAVSRIKSFTKLTPSEHKPLEVIHPPDDWPREGRVQFRNVTAVYDETNQDQAAAIQKVNLDIAPGEKIGLCGRSGSGKSSMVLTLFHMLELTNEDNSNGTILIDGIDIRSVPRDILRSRLNVLPQHPFFLHGTIRQNLDPSTLSADADDQNGTKKDANQNTDRNTNRDRLTTSTTQHRDDLLLTALHKVNLSHLATTPSELDTPFNPTTLSHGQRQLFALAGAILRHQTHIVNTTTKPQIIVLDEITSNLDHATDRTIQTIIRQEFKNCTIIAVAHRLHTISDFDRVVVMKGGGVIEMGPPAELLARGPAGSTFARMWAVSGEREGSGSSNDMNSGGDNGDDDARPGPSTLRGS